MALYKLIFTLCDVLELYVEAPSRDAAEALGRRIGTGDVDAWNYLRSIDGTCGFEFAMDVSGQPIVRPLLTGDEAGEVVAFDESVLRGSGGTKWRDEAMP